MSNDNTSKEPKELPGDFEEDDDNTIIGESTSYSQKSGMDKGKIVHDHITKCLNLMAEDLSLPGYTTWIEDKSGNCKPQNIPDYRKKYIGAVKGLKLVLSPEILKDERTKKAVEKFEKDLKLVFDKYAYRERLYKKYVWDNKEHTSGHGVWVLGNNIFMPELGAILPADNPKNPNGDDYIMEPNVWDAKHNAYYQELINIYDTLFGELNILTDVIGYFKTSSGW